MQEAKVEEPLQFKGPTGSLGNKEERKQESGKEEGKEIKNKSIKTQEGYRI
jgi:hypothetical protein